MQIMGLQSNFLWFKLFFITGIMMMILYFNTFIENLSVAELMMGKGGDTPGTTLEALKST